MDAAIESASTPDVSRDLSPFARRVRWWATASGYDRARVQVVVADGAAWIWKLWEELFPNAVQILDLYHVRERLRGVANARFGGGNSEAKVRPQLWWRRRYARLRRGKLTALLEELDAMAVAADSSAELKRVAGECALYFRNHRQRMDYPRYRRLGLCSSSAPVESMCKHIVGKRLKGSGRRWSVENANAIASLRCTLGTARRMHILNAGTSTTSCS